MFRLPSLFKPLIGLSILTIPVFFPFSARSQTIDKYLTVQPIQVCDNLGLNCADMQLYESVTDKIWAQAGVDILFLDSVQLNDSKYLSIITDPEFNQLSFSGNAGSFGRHLDSGSHTGPLNMWFVDDIETGSPNSVIFGQAWLGANGTIINDATFGYNNGIGRLDTIAHEIGHNLGLGHYSGANQSLNLLATGSTRIVPSSVGDITPDGAKTDQLTQNQINTARSSSLLGAIPKVTVDTIGSTPYNTNDFFKVKFLDGPASKTLEWLTLDLSPVDAFFDPTNSGPGQSGSGFGTDLLNGLTDSDISVSGLFDGSQSITLNFDDAFEVGDSFNFGVDIDLWSKIDAFGAEPVELNGAKFTFGFSDGYQVTSLLDNFLASSHQPLTNSSLFKPLPGLGNAPQQPLGHIEHSGHHPESVPEPSLPLLLSLGGWGVMRKLRLRS